MWLFRFAEWERGYTERFGVTYNDFEFGVIILASAGRCYCDNDESVGPNGPAFPRAQSIWLYGAGWGLRQLLSWVSSRYNLSHRLAAGRGKPSQSW